MASPGSEAGALVSYNNGTMVDLITMETAATGWTLQVAEGINAAGWIVGYGTKNGQSRAFLLTPNF